MATRNTYLNNSMVIDMNITYAGSALVLSAFTPTYQLNSGITGTALMTASGDNLTYVSGNTYRLLIVTPILNVAVPTLVAGDYSHEIDITKIVAGQPIERLTLEKDTTHIEPSLT